MLERAEGREFNFQASTSSNPCALHTGPIVRLVYRQKLDIITWHLIPIWYLCIHHMVAPDTDVIAQSYGKLVSLNYRKVHRNQDYQILH